MQQVNNLGNAKPPAQMNDADKTTITTTYREAFINAYSKIMKFVPCLLS